MQINNIKKESIYELLKDFENHIIYYFDSLKFGRDQIDTDIDISNVNEAFFFNEGKCLHIYREDEIKGVLYAEDGNEETILEKQIGNGKFKPLKSIVVKKYIMFDEDGQAYISRILPTKLIYKEEK